MAKKDMNVGMKMDFEKLIAHGELDGVDGFRAQTVNGTSFWKGTGFNKNGRGGWAAQPYCCGDQVEPDATRPSGRSNRTAE